jgi:hypothetical protein
MCCDDSGMWEWRVTRRLRHAAHSAHARHACGMESGHAECQRAVLQMHEAAGTGGSDM